MTFFKDYDIILRCSIEKHKNGVWHSLVCCAHELRSWAPCYANRRYAVRDQEVAIKYFGVWHSLVVRLVRDQEVASSNLVTPTKKAEGLVPSVFCRSDDGFELVSRCLHWEIRSESCHSDQKKRGLSPLFCRSDD